MKILVANLSALGAIATIFLAGINSATAATVNYSLSGTLDDGGSYAGTFSIDPNVVPFELLMGNNSAIVFSLIDWDLQIDSTSLGTFTIQNGDSSSGLLFQVDSLVDTLSSPDRTRLEWMDGSSLSGFSQFFVELVPPNWSVQDQLSLDLSGNLFLGEINTNVSPVTTSVSSVSVVQQQTQSVPEPGVNLALLLTGILGTIAVLNHS